MAGRLPPAAVLAGGLGTRIRAVGGDTPKVLLPVEGRPFLAHLLEYLAREGVRDVVLCTGHEAPRVAAAARDHLPAGLGLVESREIEPLGTGGALKLAASHLGPEFLIVNGDTYLESPLEELLALHRRGEAVVTLSLIRSEAAAEKGSVRVDPSGRVLDFAEKTPDGSGLVNGGVYAAGAGLLDACPPEVFCSLERTLIPGLLARDRRVLARVVDGPFVDIGLPEDYLRVRNHLPRSRRQGGTT